jgi:hypothetical protein
MQITAGISRQTLLPPHKKLGNIAKAYYGEWLVHFFKLLKDQVQNEYSGIIKAGSRSGMYVCCRNCFVLTSLIQPHMIFCCVVRE